MRVSQSLQATCESAANCPVRSALGDDCTTPQTNAHDTELVVLYRWHPWFDEQVVVDQAVARRDRAIFRCRLVKDLAAKAREVPQWMFDHAACCLMQASDEPRASVMALRRLGQLLEQRVIEDQHFLSTKGDADEPSSTGPDVASTVGSLRASPEHPAVERPSSTRASDDQDAAGRVDPPARVSTQPRKGGRR
jgi:hypothetical protein